MKKWLWCLALVLSIFSSVNAFSDEGDEADLPPIPSEEVEPGTIPYNNMIELRNWLLIASETYPDLMDVAVVIQTQLDDGDIHVHDVQDIFGWYNAEGRTYRTTRQSFRSDRIQPTRALKILDDSNRDFAYGVRLLNMVVHEYFHYKDYVANRLGSSPENSTHHRGYQVMLGVMWNHLLAEALLFEQRTPSLPNPWRMRLKIFANEFGREMNGYLKDDYNEIAGFAAPEAFKGCVRELSRYESIVVMRELAKLLEGGDKVSVALDKLEKSMRYKYPVDTANPSCVTSVNDSGRLDIHQPVGHAGPRQHLVMYAMEVPNGHSLLIEKLSGGDQIFVDGGEAVADGNGKKFVTKGYVLRWQNSGTVRFETGGTKYVIMSSVNELTAPLNYALKFKGTHVNENGETVEYDLQSRQLSLKQVAEFGYYPIHQAPVAVLFSDRSLAAPGRFYRQEVIEFNALKGDHLRFHVPAFEERDAVLYKVKGAVDGQALPELERLTTLYTWLTTIDFRADESARYVFVVYRRNDDIDNLRLNVLLQISRNGREAPSTFRPHRLNLPENANYGFHPPATEVTMVNYRQNNPSGLFGHFRSQALLDLDVRDGDLLQFNDLSDHLNRTVQLYRVDQQQWQPVQTVYSWLTGANLEIHTPGRYILAFGYNGEFGEDATATVQLRRWRHSLKGPSEARPHWLTNAEQAELGYFPFRISKVEGALTVDSPVGFIFAQNHFQLYELTNILPNSRLQLRSPAPGIGRRIQLYKVDEARFGANQKSLQLKTYMYSWQTMLDYRFEEGGRYVLALEADNANETGKVSFQMIWSQTRVTPDSIRVSEMNKNEMQDLRYRPTQ